MRNKIVQVIGCLVFFSSVLGFSSDQKRDSLIEGPSFIEIQRKMKRLRKDFPSQVELLNYGKSIEGRDLIVIRISSTQEKANPKLSDAVLITGATHGNEFLDIAHKLPRAFLQSGSRVPAAEKFLQAGGVIYVVPIFNPDGYAHDIRRNSAGVDLNRDFDLKTPNRFLSRFTQPETRNFVQFLKKDLQDRNLNLRLTYDYHCCYGSRSAILFPYSYRVSRLPKVDYDRHVYLANQLRKAYGKNFKYGSTYEVLGYTGSGTSKDYYYQNFDALAFTFEGAQGKENRRLDQHLLAWETLFSHLLR